MRRFLLLSLALAFGGAGASTSAADQAWLAEKAAEPGVVTQDSGLLYKVIVDGASPGKSPLSTTKCECNYKGALTDGTVFDSSYARGSTATFAPNQVRRRSRRSLRESSREK